MQLTFLGAAGEVTGSCLLVQTRSARFLVDCGMFQGASRGALSAAVKNRNAFQRDLGRIDFVVLTHAHIDHCGLLPRFARNTKAASQPLIYCTRPTADLVPVMLKDSAHVQSRDTRRSHRRRAPATEEPLYVMEDVDRLATRLHSVPFDVEFQPHPEVRVCLRNAGHIVGAASVLVRVRDGANERTLLVSGDLGEASPLLVSDRAPPPTADVVVVESTYGDRNHRSMADTEAELIAVLDDVLHRRHGNVIVPAFALGRTQELLVLLYRLARDGRIRLPLVFVDSPLARQASEVTFAHLDVLDELASEFHAAMIGKGGARKLPFALRYTESVDDSMFLNSIHQGAVVIAASGMCEAGRIRHHLRHNLPRRECGVLFTGFQAAGTLGRRIVDGARSVSLFGEAIPVRASVHTLGGLSAHAGQNSLMQWLHAAPRAPRAVFVAHGEPEAAHALSARIAKELRWNAVIAEAEKPYAV